MDVPGSFNIASHGEVKRLLAVAQRHLRYIRRSRTKAISVTAPGLKPDHAIVASIFSAAAVEAGLNLFISIPVLFIKNEKIRRFFGILVTRYLRLSASQKVDLVCEFCPQIKDDKSLVKRVRALFAYRNSLLHTSPDYAEPLGLPDMEEWPDNISEKDLVRRSSLTWRAASPSEVEEAFKHYQTALHFLGKLTVHGPESKDSISANSP